MANSKESHTIEVHAPIQGELPSDYADRLGSLYAKESTGSDKKQKGQFFLQC